MDEATDTPVRHGRANIGASFYRSYGKRILDLLIALSAVVILAPVMCGIAILVALDVGRPVIFRHIRPGLGGQLFTMFKFRSMRHATDSAGNILGDQTQEAYAAARAGLRHTRLGEFLRRTSLDELPELFNVIAGKMSLVGPRPLLTEYLERYSEEQARRHDVKPGITGWAQIHGRQAISYEARFVLDVWYVDHLSLWLDLKILGLTVVQVLRRRDVKSTWLRDWYRIHGFS